jgi:hypothetical protein
LTAHDLGAFLSRHACGNDHGTDAVVIKPHTIHDYPWHLALPRIVSDGTDPYAVLGVLIEGAVRTIAQRIPTGQQMETAATLVQLLEERLKAHGVPGGDR